MKGKHSYLSSGEIVGTLQGSWRPEVQLTSGIAGYGIRVPLEEPRYVKHDWADENYDDRRLGSGYTWNVSIMIFSHWATPRTIPRPIKMGLTVICRTLHTAPIQIDSDWVLYTCYRSRYRYRSRCHSVCIDHKDPFTPKWKRKWICRLFFVSFLPVKIKWSIWLFCVIFRCRFRLVSKGPKNLR